MSNKTGRCFLFRLLFGLFLLVGLWQVYSVSVYAQGGAEIQGQSLHKIPKYDTTYISPYPRKWTIRPYLAFKTLDLQLEQNKTRLNYVPNMPLQIGVLVGYKRLGIGGSIAIPGTSRPNELYGKTDYFDLDLGLYTRRIIFDGGYAVYKGFRLQNFNEYKIPEPKPDGFPIRKDLRVHGFRANVFYVFNHRKYSYKATYQQLERQYRSAGSFLLMVAANMYNIHSDTSLIPIQVRDKFTDNENLTGAIFTSLALAPGYGYTLRYRNWSFAGSLFLGLALQGGRVKSDNEKPLRIKSVGGKTNLRLAIGYEKNRFFFGGLYYVDTIIFNAADIKLQPVSNNLCVYVGRRW